jgi:hypothetical protein
MVRCFVLSGFGLDLVIRVIRLTPMKGVKGKFWMVGYIGLLSLRLVISERFRFHCSLSVLQRLILLSAHVDVICDSAM